MEIQHQHPLILEDLQSMYLDYEEDDDEFDDNDLITKQSFKCTCDMCGLEIDWYHRYYYNCNSCNYSLHKFCSEMSSTLRFPAHPIHILSLKKGPDSWSCEACFTQHQNDDICYHCSTCNYAIDLPCVTFVEQTTIHHPGHPHPLICATLDASLNNCFACGKKHQGVFYHCVTCFNFSIHVDCVTLPFKFKLENLHRHMLTLSYSFTLIPDNSKCRICRLNISDRLWLYKCSKCRFYVHIDCATSRGEPFMSIFSRGMGKTDANFIAADYPDLLRYPLPDESYNIIPHKVQKGKNYKHFDQIRSFSDGKHYMHEHQLRLISDTSISGIQLHDPIKRIKLICSGCVRPITSTPFYVCFMMQDNNCDFCLHEWCTRLPTQLENHPGHPQHTLALFHVLSTEVSTILTGFECAICRLRFNGFGYACSTCNYRVDVNCGFIPEKITHESHSRDHLLSVSVVDPTSMQSCQACDVAINGSSEICYKCISCDFYLDSRCALHLPKTIKNKYDKHPLKLSYSPIENHKSQYFCEVCEEGLTPEKWFYHCIECGQSIHSACAPLILQSEQDVNSSVHVEAGVYMFLNMKLGGLIPFQTVSAYLLAGVKSHGKCNICLNELQSSLIIKSSDGNVDQFAFHVFCALDMAKSVKDTGDRGRYLFDKLLKALEKVNNEHEMSGNRVRLTFYPGRVTRPVTGHWKPDAGVIIKHP